MKKHSLFLKAAQLSCVVYLASVSGAAALAAEKLSDAQIAEIVMSANSADVQAGQIARSKSQNKMVKDMASHMIRDHQANNQQLQKLGKKEGLQPMESEASQDLKKDAREASQKLQNLQASEFDRQYVDHEVAFHQKVLDQLKGTLIPNAKDPQVKKLLTQTVPVIEQHLAHAKSLQRSLQQAGEVPSKSTDMQ